jgi:hypothetical protein
MEGTRPMLIEIQSLTAQSVFGYPKRTANGFDYNRLAVLIAVLEKRIKEWDELRNKLSRIKSVASELSKDKDKILYFFNSVENSED